MPSDGPGVGVLEILELAGTPKIMGEGFGETYREQIQEFYRLRVVNALAQARQFGGRRLDEGALLEVSRRSLSVTESYDPDGFAELAGIARAAHLTVEQALAMNGLTDLRDVLAYWSHLEAPASAKIDGCSSFIVTGDRTADGDVLGGQSWDLATDNMPYVIAVHRRPQDGPQTWSLTTMGCLSLIGLNEEGIAVGTTNLRSKDSRPGLCYLTLIHRALSRRRFDDAVASILAPHRAAAHYYCVLGPAKEAVALECTATRHERIDVGSGVYVHCNHFLDEANRALDANVPKEGESTVCRQARMSELLSTQAVNVAVARRALSDHEGGDGAICRHDLAGISSNGAALIEPATRRMWACRGTPCTAEWCSIAA